jgi:Fic family protein
MANSLIDDFQFRNDPIWIKYSHERYLPIEDIRHRTGLDLQSEEWKELSKKIRSTRILQSLPFFIPSINKTFWYFEADCIRKKLSEVEKMGIEIYDKIHSSKTFEEDFFLNSMIEEAVTSVIYEGANTTRSKAKQLIAENRLPKDNTEQMLLNNLRALKWIKGHVNSPIDINSILTIHSIVTQNTMEGDLVNYVGTFRDDVAYIGKHTGIEHQLIEQALNEAIVQCTQSPRFIHPLIQGILLHYFIAYIHPFFDGNGRTARTIFYFNGIKHNLDFLELLSISASLKRHGKRYERSFDNAVNHEGDLTYFIDFSLDSLKAALKVVSGKIVFLQNIWTLKDKLSLSDNQIALLQRLALHKHRLITINEYAGNINKSHEMARQLLKQLAGNNLLIESKKGRNLTYQIDSKYLKSIVPQEDHK